MTLTTQPWDVGLLSVRYPGKRMGTERDSSLDGGKAGSDRAFWVRHQLLTVATQDGGGAQDLASASVGLTGKHGGSGRSGDPR